MKMNVKKTVLCGLVLFSVSLFSCKKEEETTFKYLSGLPTFTLPMYATMGQTFTVTPAKVTHPDGEGYGYYWKTSWSDVKDTTKTIDGTGDGTFTFTTPNEIGEYTVSCVVFADGYSTSSSKATIYVVDITLGTTVKGTGILPADDHFTDARDGKTYYTVAAGGKTWMRNNLGYNGLGEPYLSSTAMDYIIGRFYSWNEAKQACPEGWRLPTESDWTALAASADASGSFHEGETFSGIAGALMADARFLDTKMWEFWPNVKISNTTAMAVLPVGYAVSSDRIRFTGMNTYAVFWTADSSRGNGLFRYLYVDKNDVFSGEGDPDSFLATVRCVKD